MRINATFITSLLLATAATARLQHSRRNGLTQAHQSRDLVDLCVALDANVVVDLLAFLGLEASLCLCLHDLDLFLDTDIRAQAQVKAQGRDAVKARLAAQFHSDNNPRVCPALQPHAHRVRACGGDPCRFECDTGFVLRNGQCVCPPGLTECNGKCTRGCASGIPGHWWKARHNEPIASLKQAQDTCKRGEIVCGVVGSSTGFECLNPSTQLDSCGGCVVPHPWQSSAPSPVGQDCNELVHQHALDFSCQAGSCVVSSCKAGLEPNALKNKCTNPSGSDPDSIATVLSESLQLVAKLRAAISAAASVSVNINSQAIDTLLRLSAKIGSTSLKAIHRPLLCNDLIDLVIDLNSNCDTALSLQGWSPDTIIALRDVDNTASELVSVLLNLSAALGECGCHDDQKLLEAINTIVVGHSAFNDLAFQLNRRQAYVPQNLPAQEKSVEVNAVTTLNIGSAVLDISNPKIVAPLQTYAIIIDLAYSLRADSHSLASCTQSDSPNQCSTNILELTEAIISDLDTELLCLDDAVEKSKQLLHIVEACPGDDGDLKPLLQSLRHLALHLWVKIETAADELDQCGCKSNPNFTRGTTLILDTFKLDLITRSFKGRRVRRANLDLLGTDTSLQVSGLDQLLAPLGLVPSSVEVASSEQVDEVCPNDSASSSTTPDATLEASGTIVDGNVDVGTADESSSSADNTAAVDAGLNTPDDTDPILDGISSSTDALGVLGDINLGLGIGDNLTLSAIVDSTYELLNLRNTLYLDSQTMTHSCNCSLSSADPLSTCVFRTYGLAGTILHQSFDLFNVESLSPLLNQLDSLLRDCLGHFNTFGFDDLLDINSNLLTTTESLLGLLERCGCKDNQSLIAAAKKLTASDKVGSPTTAHR